MNDLQPWQKSFTSRFAIPTNCKCNMCEGPIPWKTLGIIALVFGTVLLAFN